jgi:hypothetical protein
MNKFVEDILAFVGLIGFGVVIMMWGAIAQAIAA